MKRNVQRFVLIFSIATVASAQPLVDGYFHQSEWSGATQYPITLNLPEGGTTAGTIYILNDATDLYFAVRYERTTIDAFTAFNVTFDRYGDGPWTEDDDSVGLQGWACFPQTFYDGVLTTLSPPCYPGTICNTSDPEVGGTEDGTGAVGRDGIIMAYEVRHPLYSNDGRDIAAKSGDTMQFGWYVGLSNAAGTGAMSWGIEQYTVQ